MSQQNSLGFTGTVAGPVRPYVIEDKETGEVVSGCKIQFPGGSVGVKLPEKIATRMVEGQVWRFSGRVTVSSQGKASLVDLTEGRQLEQKAEAADVAIEFLDDAPATAAKRTGAKS